MYDRTGVKSQGPLVTISLAIITSRNFKSKPQPARIAQIAAHVKKKIKKKQKERSGYLVERRIYS